MSDYFTKTKLMTYRKCPKLYQYRFVKNIQEMTNSSMERGILLHEFFESYNKGETQEAARTLEIIKVEGFQEHVDSFLEFNTRIKKDDTKVLVSEERITVASEKLQGIIDVVYETEDGSILLDYKTGKFHTKNVHDYRVELGFYYDLLVKTSKVIPTHWGMFFTGNNYLFSEKIDDVKLRRVRKSIRLAQEGIKAGNFPQKFSYICDYCQFKKECWG